MDATNLERLGSLHDAIVHDVCFDATSIAGREVRISITCSKQVDYQPWAGKRVTLIAHDVLVMRQLIWTTADLESVNLVSVGISDDARQQLKLFDKGNSRLTGEPLTIAFHSGSYLELICRDFLIQMQE